MWVRVEWMGWLSWIPNGGVIVLYGKGWTMDEWMEVWKGMRGHFVTMSNSDVIFVWLNKLNCNKVNRAMNNFGWMSFVC